MRIRTTMVAVSFALGVAGMAVAPDGAVAKQQGERGETADTATSNATDGGTSTSGTSGSKRSKAGKSSGANSGSSESDPLGPAAFKPGTMDFHGAIGMPGFLYLAFEPGVDVGVVPIDKNVTFSVGGTLGIGYCVFCGIITGLSDDSFSLRSWNLAPQGRALFHINSVGRSLGAPLDFYGGISMGPNFYFWRVEIEEASARQTTTTFLVSPLIGARIFPTGTNTFFLFGEARYRTEWGFSKVTVEFDNYSEDFEWTDSYAQRGLELVAGGGIRF